MTRQICSGQLQEQSLSRNHLTHTISPPPPRHRQKHTQHTDSLWNATGRTPKMWLLVTQLICYPDPTVYNALGPTTSARSALVNFFTWTSKPVCYPYCPFDCDWQQTIEQMMKGLEGGCVHNAALSQWVLPITHVEVDTINMHSHCVSSSAAGRIIT